MSDLPPAQQRLLEQTLGLAELGRPGARPNPVVGAILARADGTLVASGHHARYGGPHAERAALDEVEAIPPDSVLYVSLEPCAHHGKQPPCAELIVRRGVRRVVVASPDTNPETAGLGIRRLREAGVRVEWGPRSLARRAIQQNAGFHARHRWGRPYVTYKWAMTRNGRLATGDPERRWISSPASRELVHYLRAGAGAVAVGIGTVLADDPLLTVRGAFAWSMLTPPLRVVFDRRLRLPLASKLVQTAADAPVLAVTTTQAPAAAQDALERAGVEVYRAASGGGFLDDALRELARRGVGDVLLESGPRLATAMHQAGLVDALTCFVAPLQAPPDQPGFPRDHPFVAAVRAGQRARSGDDTVAIRVLREVDVELDPDQSSSP